MNWQFIDTTCSLVTNGVVANVVVVVVIESMVLLLASGVSILNGL